jgi:5-methylcytosine-specific restriction protein A
MAQSPKKIQRSYVPEYKAFERNNDNSDFYNSWPWRKAAKRFKDNNPICVECDKIGIVTKVKVVDHILPINKGGERLDEANFQSLCESCHNKKSASEKGGYGVKSL